MPNKYDFKSIIKKRNYPSWIKAPLNARGESLDLYIATYPVVAKYLANRIQNKNKIFAELCCGLGISLIYFSNKFKKLIGVDINKAALKFCKENLNSAKDDLKFNLKDYLLIQGDISNITLLKKLSGVEVVAYDVPYWFDHNKNLTKKNPEIKTLINSIRKYVTNNIVIYAPPHINFDEITKQLGDCEFQKIYLNDKHDRTLIYFGNLIEKKGLTEIKLRTKK